MIIKCVALAIDLGGERDLVAVKVNCTEGQVDNGDHFYQVTNYLEREGFEVLGVFDENDRAGNIMDKFAWETIITID